MAIDFSKAMAEVSTIVDTSTVSMEMMSDSVREIALVHGQTTTSVAKGLYQAVSSGAKAGAEAIEFLTTATQLGVAGVASTSDAVDLLSGVLANYRTEGITAERASDILFKTVEKGRTTIGALAGSFGRVLPLSKQMGVSLEEAAASLATLTLTLGSTEEASTALRGTFTQMLRTSDEGKKILDEAGISFDKSAIKAKGFAGVLGEVSDKLGDNSDALNTLFPDIRAYTGALSLLDDQSRLLIDNLDAITLSVGSFRDALDKQLADPGFRATATTNALNIGLEKLGQVLLGEFSLAMGDGVEGIKGLEQAVSDLDVAVKPLIGTAAQLARVVVWFADVVPDASEAYSELDDRLAAVADRMFTLTENTDTATSSLWDQVKAAEALGQVQLSLDEQLRLMFERQRRAREDQRILDNARPELPIEADFSGDPRRGTLIDPRRFGPVISPRPERTTPIGTDEQRKLLSDTKRFADELAGIARQRKQLDEENRANAIEAQAFVDRLSSQLGGVFNLVVDGARGFGSALVDAARGADDAFEQFAERFLLRMADMIAQAAILELLFHSINAISTSAGSAFTQSTGVGQDSGLISGIISGIGSLFSPSATAEPFVAASGAGVATPGAVASEGGGVNHTYNIYANDSASFVQMVARNPRAIAQVVASTIQTDPAMKSAFGVRGVVK